MWTSLLDQIPDKSTDPRDAGDAMNTAAVDRKMKMHFLHFSET